MSIIAEKQQHGVNRWLPAMTSEIFLVNNLQSSHILRIDNEVKLEKHMVNIEYVCSVHLVVRAHPHNQVWDSSAPRNQDQLSLRLPSLHPYLMSSVCVISRYYNIQSVVEEETMIIKHSWPVYECVHVDQLYKSLVDSTLEYTNILFNGVLYFLR